MSNDLKELIIKTAWFMGGLVLFITLGILLMLLLTLIQYNDSVYNGAIGLLCIAAVCSIYGVVVCFSKVLAKAK